MSNLLALYTTVYQGAEKFLHTWHESVCAQTDREFDLWVGADQIDPRSVFNAVGRDFQAHWVIATPERRTPAGVRQCGIDTILASERRYKGIVFIDCDDMMHPDRIESARSQLENTDVAACAMEIVNEDGSPTDLVFRLRPSTAIPHTLAKTNVFGMSNSTYRAETLRKIPSTPSQCRLMDWFIATSAWIRGARFDFDSTPRMQYRQYDRNTARVLPPFTAADISLGTALVLDHYRLVLSSVPDIPDSVHFELESALANAQLFLQKVVRVPNTCEQYVHRLNDLSMNYVWWEWVAHPSLEDLWRS